MIDIKHLSKTFQNDTILNDISFHLAKGDVMAIIGSSGAGKSTLLRCINRLEQPEHGEVTIAGEVFNLATLPRRDLVRLRQSTAMVFQQFSLFQQKTALENVMEGLTIVKKYPKEKAKKVAMAQLKKVGLAERADYYPRHLSGGQQQRVGIARALAMEPQILLLDEPTSALDPELVTEVLDVIKQAALEGNTMIIVSHEMDFVRQVANRVLFLEKGKIIEDGSAQQVFDNPKHERTKAFLARYYRRLEPEYQI
ncbi:MULTISPECIES: amino acid ABC transporter ATP-binding protein [unclassified Symbiopectobacterium]|uniref:amino acid ABC transporter ATP-binding protein n=1 Tax=unclassified Symbiopectobacterium TaxID=2794573 RepID=UPI00222608A3|nr:MULTISPECIES: amino acid ABC transporter ATP-binding protein [unclassified Symbiopectobacterium]MCW2473976.1 amino acid ABC transporter ATP-binding protein [Candidatus Symbiopectobacterium sp. NZEC151]MCW2485219.1 amino acid ABC transporter ATP-binding protein [Candidatus Symbiopectobacterium sp. NZEC127]